MPMLGLLLTIAALGDSVTVGPAPVRVAVRGRRAKPAAAPPPGSSYVAVLGRQLGEPAINGGVAANTSTQMLARLQKDVLAKRPRAVIIMAGLNDAAWVDPGPVARSEPRVSEEDFEKNLKAMVEQIKAAGAAPILLTPNPMTRAYKYQNMPYYQENDINDGLAPYADIVRRVARLSGACLVDVFGDWLARPGHRRLLSDGLHPNAAGHKIIANKIMESCGSVLRPMSKGPGGSLGPR
jgi:lysophospholipase L1-like esterase